MKEFKVRYPKEKAEKILQEIGAEFQKESVQRDLYLISDGEDIVRLAEKDGVVSLVHFTKQEDGFGMDMSKEVNKDIQATLSELIARDPGTITKTRQRYTWQGSEIATDVVAGVGEFIELYPENETIRNKMFETFNIEEADLIGESYYDLKNR